MSDSGPGARENGLALVLCLMSGVASMGTSGGGLLPSLAQDVGIPTATSAWVISGFSLTYGVAMAVHGRLADLVGLRPPDGGGRLHGRRRTARRLSTQLRRPHRRPADPGDGPRCHPRARMAVVSAHYTGGVKARALATGASAPGACIGPLVGGSLDALFSWRVAVALPAVAVFVCR